MLILGLISIAQIILLPGLAAINVFKIKTCTPIQKWLYIFSLSLFINYTIITILTMLSAYTIISLWLIIIFEFFLLLLFSRNKGLDKIFSSFNFRSGCLKLFKYIKSSQIGDRVIIIISGIILLFYFAVFFANIGTIFYFVDTVNNYEWNRWAIDFANNILPKYSSHFPQLLPANWSICYVLIGKMDVHFFPKAIMPLFFIGNLLMFVDLAITKNSKVFLIGVIIYGLFAPIIYSLEYIADGNADLPVSFFAFLTFYSFLRIFPIKYSDLKNEKLIEDFNLNDYLLTFLFASAAAATKLAGFYTFTFASLFLCLIFIIKRRQINRYDIIKAMIFAVLVVSISLFWHFRAPEVMYSGLNQPEYLSPGGYIIIFMKALKLMYYNFGLPVFAFFIITITASLLHKRVRFISLLMVIIPTILWMFKYSADFRNLSFVVPFLCLCSAFGFLKLIEYLSKKNTLVKNIPFENFTGKKPIALDIGRQLSQKNRFALLSISIISSILLVIFLSGPFYHFLYKIYEFINKYYFHSSRIVYFIEYGLLLHVDFYQRVFIALSILLIISPIIILTKIRLKLLIIFAAASLVFLNFTALNEKNILTRQSELFDKVDARNYQAWLKMIIDEDSGKEVYTNFKAILNQKIPGEIKFKYFKNISELELNRITSKNRKIFLKSDIIKRQAKDFIESKITSGVYKVILDNKKYIFFIINPT